MVALAECDVAIVGLGPVGAVAANLLGRAGFEVVVLEQAKHIFDKPRAIVVDHEALRVLQACDLPDDLNKYIEPYSGSNYLNEAGEIIRRYHASPPPFPLGWPSSASFIQPELEELLRAGLAAIPNVTVHLQRRVIDMQETSGAPTLTVHDLVTDEWSMLRANYVIGCDGGSSIVRKLLGATFEDLRFDETWVVVDAWLRRETPLPELSTQHCWPSRPTVFVRGPRNLRRWEMKLLPHEQPEYFEDRENILHELQRFVDVSALDIWRAALYRSHSIIAEQWRFGQVFLAGDAAHMNPPFAGQGLCSGIRDAANLTWKLWYVDKQGAQDSLLDTYELERKAHVRVVVEHSKSIGLIIGELDPAAAAVRDERMKEELASGAGEMYRQRYIPPLEQGLLHYAGGKLSEGAGSLFVQPRVITSSGEERLLDDVTGRRFVLVAGNTEVPGWLNEASRDDTRRMDCRVVVVLPCAEQVCAVSDRVIQVTETDRLLGDWLELKNAVGAVVRPDGYVYGLFHDAETMNATIRDLADSLFHSDRVVEPAASQ